MKMRGKPDVSSFIEGAAAAEKQHDQPKQQSKAVPVRQKGLRLPLPVLTKLRRRAVHESEMQGRRVTEQEIIITALESYLGAGQGEP
jgi:hypothetical protein